MAKASVVFPVPGTPANMRWGMVLGFLINALRLSTMSFRPTTSSRVLGRYFSTHIKDSSGRLVWGVAIRIPQVNVHCILGGYRFMFSANVHVELGAVFQS